MKRILPLTALLLGACAVPPPPKALDPSIKETLAQTEERRKPQAPALEQQLLPPLRMEMPQVSGEPMDQRFDLSVNNAPAGQVFASLVAGTRYSMLVNPRVSGNITLNLKDVTLREALDSIREVYGYEYKIEGTRIFVQPAGIQARVFHIDYLALQRRGLSQVRVAAPTLINTPSSGIGTNIGVGATTALGATPGTAAAGQIPPVGGALSPDSARVTTNQEATFWSDLCEALVALTFPADEGQKQAAQEPATVQGAEDRQRGMCNRRHAGSDRSIVVTPQSGVIVVRATPAELRSVENYLRATRLAVERQVMLEAKIIEVTLSDQYQSGINWAIFNRQGAIGQVTRPAGQTQLAPDQTVRSTVRNAAASQILNGPSGAVVGLAVASPHFGALLTFLETQGKVQVLSSPRVATLNNQKAVLKVGTDQLFVSNVTVTPPTATVAGTVSTATTIAPQFSPYFSGIVLDVTPQIDDRGNITLHIHPTINDITPTPLTIDFGLGPVNLPTASNSIRETDTIVRVSDGNIVAIGGLMQTQVNDTRGGIPGVSDSGPAGLFLRSTNRLVQKKELVILLKPTVVESDGEWTEDLRETRERVDALGREMGTRIGQ